MKCKMVPASKETWDRYASWLLDAGVQAAVQADGWIFISVDLGGKDYPASGAALFIGPESIGLAGFGAHPHLPKRELYTCAVLTVRSAMSFATTLGRQLRAHAPTRGIARLLMNQGWKPAGPALPGIWFVQPGLGPFEAPLPQRAPKPREDIPAELNRKLGDAMRSMGFAVTEETLDEAIEDYQRRTGTAVPPQAPKRKVVAAAVPRKKKRK